ncbi:Malate/lactate/ureidoglycolate dehydrogenase, LDH2 family [Bosea sp. 62]|uniref:Ldh family oxidoreductase n=1 Tax=unclassified Bosea (in: a-proteobacteria) TaxID=2653178 RepID=UPI001258BB97|nr:MULTISPECIES: Ldh family oxidoreductase [unclassified Bosea (in: a-proteobacteria)]CAD5253509.1 Malate/lactate/ureidoglycolate dehydrogenase, LDH2 family [Bosea sp. 46]CAD5258284.1 Malate/lactate/ureidoglycolate dehydrogenase, LDH2 family [Bosea sp. 21B]CAD5282629.1 Malate/lactate/ureidoglycolate dehydrogenase, LDH2 family [Bosea sp. 7B]VVT51992.1 Malate/lactate/ureidoglycolate dehydrogenase, LDH2 family [Bosea sp. EC-HK365B]VXB40539.1 Malate/lactate/ureidoglycolate dehydrogenase, LDH2 fami
MPKSGRYPAEALRSFAVALLEAAGAPPGNAAIVAKALVDADIEGLASHGLLQLPMYLERIARGSVDPAATGEIVVDAGSRLTLDAQNGLGHVTAERACEIAIARAAEHGVAIVAVRNAFHFGAAGRFARRIALAGKIGIVMANTRPMLPAPGGAEAVVGNNPLAIAVPTGGEPIVLDLAMSAGAMGKVRLAASKGEPIPEGWALTAEGLPTRDAAEAIKGVLLPAAGAKGFGLAVMVDLLAGGLSAGGIGAEVQPLYGDLSRPYGSANLIMAIEIEGMRPLPDYEAAASGFADHIRQSKAAPSAAPIRLPGDRAADARKRFDGSCALAAGTLAALHDQANRLGIAIPDDLGG